MELIAAAKTIPQTVRALIEEMKIHDAVDKTIALIRRVNAYLEIKAPWQSIKEDRSQKGSAATTLALASDVLRIGSQLLSPVIPKKVQLILDILGANSIPLSNTSVGKLKAGAILGVGKSPFPRIITK